MSYDFIFNWENSLNTETVELRRKTIVATDYGSETITEAKIADITVSIQPISNTDLLNLQEGDRERVVYVMYTKYSSIDTEDLIKRFNIKYQVKKPPMPWYILGQLHHYKVFLYKIENE